MVNKFKKTLNLIDVTLATAGYIIGAGIYAILGVASKYGKQYTWISILISGLFSICTGLSYSELASMNNQNAGEYYITKDSFNKSFATIVALITILSEILTQCVISESLSSHLTKLIPITPKIMSCLFLISYGFLNYRGIRSSANYNNLATILEVLGLIAVSIGSIPFIKPELFDLSSFKKSDIMPIILGGSVMNFAYFGYDMALELTEETINSKKNIPLGMLYGITIALILYMSVTISGLSTIGWKELSKSNTPIVDIANKIFGSTGLKLLFGIAIISMSNTLLMSNVSASRFIQRYTNDNLFLKKMKLDVIDKKTNTPINAIIFITITSILLIFLIRDFDKLISFSNISIFIVFIIMNLSVIVLRYKYPKKKRVFKVPFNLNNLPIPSIIAIIIGLVSIILVYKDIL